MIKADAYGHGSVEVYRALFKAGQKNFGLATLEEAIELRIKNSELREATSLLVFSPLNRAAFKAAIEHNVTLVLSSWQEIQELEAVCAELKLKNRVQVHLKFNTGMSRLGFDIQDSEKLSQKFYQHSALELEGVCTHLAEGEDSHLEDGFSAEQFKKFAEVEKKFSQHQIYFHALNSLGLIGTYLNSKLGARWGARPGLSLYGIKPELYQLSGEMAEKWKSIDLQPVLELKTKVILVQPLKKGESVSYNRRWTCQKDSQIGVLPIGYADGYHRRLTNKGRMLVAGQLVPVVGTVCMDYTLVDLTHLESKTNWRDATVTIIGQDNNHTIKAEELADAIGTNAYEVLTSISRRVPRVYR